MKKGPYTIITSKSVYKNPWISITEERALHDSGKESIFGVIDYGSGVSILALDKNKNVYLIREYYYAIEDYALQLPSGGIDKNESPIEAAKRELLEETGIKNGEWIDLGYVHPLTMILKSPAYLFLVKNCEVSTSHESGIEIIKKPFKDVYQMALTSKINHAPSCVAILKAHEFLKENS